MKRDDTVAQQLPAILAIARLAPSVHNTQPWRVQADGNNIEVSLDPGHSLKPGDPTGRETIISLGIFCEALRLAAGSCGLSVSHLELRDRQAIISLRPDAAGQAAARQAVELLRRRCTDRSLFRPVPIAPRLIKDLESVETAGGTSVRVITDRNVISQIARLTGRGIRLALSNPEFRRELSRYLLVPWSRKKRGIAVRSLYIAWPLAVLEPLLMRWGIGVKTEAVLERRRWLSASGVVAILGDGDLSKYWLEAGRTYLRVSLAIEAAGLSQATSAAIVEASNYHDDIEAAIGSQQRILALIRIGQGRRRRRYSPRVSVEDLLTSR